MGEALLFGGGGSSGGIRNKKITKAGYLNLTEEEKTNPYICWIITDADATDFTNVYGTEIVTKVLVWEAYCNLAEEDRLAPNTLWIISDKTPEELSVLDIDTDSGSKYYNVCGAPSSIDYKRIDGVDYELNIDSSNPIANMAVANKIEELESALGGLKFTVTESGGLRIIYDDGT